MRFSEFVRRQMSENGEPSNNRVMLFLFLTTVMLMVLAVVFVPVFRPGVVITLPIIPSSFEVFVEVITGTLVGGALLSKGVAAYKDKGAETMTTKTETTAIVKGAPDGGKVENNP